MCNGLGQEEGKVLWEFFRGFKPEGVSKDLKMNDSEGFDGCEGEDFKGEVSQLENQTNEFVEISTKIEC
jgi:hypothetical protein